MVGLEFRNQTRIFACSILMLFMTDLTFLEHMKYVTLICEIKKTYVIEAGKIFCCYVSLRYQRKVIKYQWLILIDIDIKK